MAATKLSDYQVYNLLGTGSFASVYKASYKPNQKVFALKMIDKNIMNNKNMRGRVCNEVEIHSKLKHPTILSLYDYFEDSKFVYLVLEYCCHGELNHYISQYKCNTNRGVTEIEARKFLKQIIEGVSYLHSLQIIHRDLSVSNILLSASYSVKICDFGLAIKLTTPNEKHFTLCGTPNFISPEAIDKSHSHSFATDIWSIGCILFTLLTGTPPFDTKQVKKTFNKVLSGNFNIPPYVSQEASDLIVQLLQHDPIKRPSLVYISRHPFIKISSLHHKASSDFPKLDTQDFLFSCSQANVLDHNLLPPSKYEAFVKSRDHNLEPQKFNNCYFEYAKTTSPNFGGEPIASVLKDKNGRTNRQKSLLIKVFDSISQSDTANHFDKYISSKSVKTVTSPLKTHRLRPNSQKIKDNTFSLLSSGDVLIEFDGKKFCEKFKVSGDGKKVFWESMSPSAKCEFSYESLPPFLWKKYCLAHKYVKLLKAKTPKLVLYTGDAKCMLMENEPEADFEVRFNDGVRYLLSNRLGTSISDAEGKKFYTSGGEGRQLPNHLRGLEEKSLEYHRECVRWMNAAHSTVSDSKILSESCLFPIIIGTNPKLINLDNLGHSLMNNKTNHSSSQKRLCESKKSFFIPNLCWISFDKGGDDNSFTVHFLDGTQFLIDRDQSKLIFVGANGIHFEIHKEDFEKPLPSNVRSKLQNLPYIIDQIKKVFPS